MGENTRLLYDLMHYLEENDLDGLLLLVDFEKAFNSIEFLIAEAIFKSVLSKLIGRQLPMYLLSLPPLGIHVITP
jgi:hypothetical protein